LAQKFILNSEAADEFSAYGRHGIEWLTKALPFTSYCPEKILLNRLVMDAGIDQSGLKLLVPQNGLNRSDQAARVQ